MGPAKGGGTLPNLTNWAKTIRDHHTMACQVKSLPNELKEHEERTGAPGSGGDRGTPCGSMATTTCSRQRNGLIEKAAIIVRVKRTTTLKVRRGLERRESGHNKIGDGIRPKRRGYKNTGWGRVPERMLRQGRVKKGLSGGNQRVSICMDGGPSRTFLGGKKKKEGSEPGNDRVGRNLIL